MSRNSFTYQLYLYLWPFWLFRDVNRGSLLERAAAWRHNRAQRVHLPGYALKWTVLTAMQGGVLAGVDQGSRAIDDWLWLSASLGTTVSVSVCVIAVCVAAWGYLSWVDE
jgi:hypothetical protein